MNANLRFEKLYLYSPHWRFATETNSSLLHGQLVLIYTAENISTKPHSVFNLDTTKALQRQNVTAAVTGPSIVKLSIN